MPYLLILSMSAQQSLLSVVLHLILKLISSLLDLLSEPGEAQHHPTP